MSPSSITLFSGIFVSYRRDDSSGHAGRLFDHLVNHFGEDRIFMDIDIEPGEDFVTTIENALRSCEILIAIIGRQWLFEAGETTRRLDNPNDFVRLEIATALSRDIQVIPVLVQRASMPKPQDLPDELARFARRNAIEVSDFRWRHDVDQLIRVLERTLNDREEARRRAAQEEKERHRKETQEKLRAEEQERKRRVAAEAERREAEEVLRQRRAEERVRAEAEASRLANQKTELRRVEAEREERQRYKDEEQARTDRERLSHEATEADRQRVTLHVKRDQRTVVKPGSSSADSQTLSGAIQPRSTKRKRIALIVILASLALLSLITLLWMQPRTNGGLGSANLAATPTIGSSPPLPSPTPSATPQAPFGMVFVPGGEFIMGRNDGTEYERPAHPVSVKPFLIDIYEVTNEDYVKFIKSTGHAAPGGWRNEWTDNGVPLAMKRKPVTGIRWHDAVDYANWASKRLPTEEEWEFAARGTDGRKYPWGNKWGVGLANASGAGKGLAAVGTFQGKSPYGLYDMAGNAWEWTSSDIREYTSQQAPPKSSRLKKIIRGGTWESGVEYVTTTYRRAYRISGANDYSNLGFRCAKDLPNINTVK